MDFAVLQLNEQRVQRKSRNGKNLSELFALHWSLAPQRVQRKLDVVIFSFSYCYGSVAKSTKPFIKLSVIMNYRLSCTTQVFIFTL